MHLTTAKLQIVRMLCDIKLSESPEAEEVAELLAEVEARLFNQSKDDMKFRKKPVVIEAFQMTIDRRSDNKDWPEWLNEAWNRPIATPGSVFASDYPNSNGADKMQISTLEGIHFVDWDDWIIQGVKGELYPCKPDIFALTYEPV